jgi:hypothetical protein
MDAILAPVIMIALAFLIIGILLGIGFTHVYVYKRAYRAAKQEQLAELQQWKLEALQSRLQLASVQTLF